MNFPKAIICALDGTLCDNRHRLHFVDPRFNTDFKEKINSGCMSISDGFFNRVTNEKFTPDYESYYAGIPDDGVNEAVSEILGICETREDGLTVPKCLLISGRPEKYRKSTEDWLYLNVGTIWDKLFMRPDFLEGEQPCNCGDEHIGTISNWPPAKVKGGLSGRMYATNCCTKCENLTPKGKPDHRPAFEVKREIFEREIRDKYDVLFVIEDSEECAAMYKGLGLTVLQVK